MQTSKTVLKKVKFTLIAEYFILDLPAEEGLAYFSTEITQVRHVLKSSIKYGLKALRYRMFRLRLTLESLLWESGLGLDISLRKMRKLMLIPIKR